MTDQDLLNAIESSAKDNKLPCREALAIANKFDVSPGKVGKICTESKVQIVSCQLGCFGTKDKTSWT